MNGPVGGPGFLRGAGQLGQRLLQVAQVQGVSEAGEDTEPGADFLVRRVFRGSEDQHVGVPGPLVPAQGGQNLQTVDDR